MSKNYSTYQLGHFSAWQTTKISSQKILKFLPQPDVTGILVEFCGVS